MPSFGFLSRSRGKTANTLKVKEFQKSVPSLPWYNALKKMLPEPDADEILGMILDKQARKGDRFDIGASTKGAFTAAIDQLLEMEAMKIQGRRAYVAGLLGRARAGDLRRDLAAKTMPEADYWTPGVAQPWRDGSIDLEVQKAYRWITRSWQGDGRHVVLSALTDYVLIRPGIALGPDPSLLDDVYGRVVSNAPAIRAPNFMVNYPSHVGGRHLLEWVFRQGPVVAWPARGADAWEDYALFFLGAIVAVQGFTDGNKRMGRLAYAIVLLRGGRRFVAPTPAFENELFAMSM